MALYYQEYGDEKAPLMVFLHGGGVSSWMWDKQVQYLTHYHCVALDLPEQGRSKHGTDFTIKSSAEKVIDLMKKIANKKEIIVVGFSLGAQVTVQMLSVEPDLIDYAVINSALARPITFGKKMIRPSTRLTFPLIKNRSFSKLQAKTLYVDEEYFEKYYEENSQMKLDTLVRILEENMSFEIPNGFSKASGKILVTVGEKEKAVMKKSAIDIVKNNPNSTGVIIPNIGHGIPLAKPEFFNDMIEQWINEGSIPKGGKEIR